MAQIKVLVDDMDGTADTSRPVKTVPFSIDGVDYVIDLHSDNENKLRENFAQYVQAARRVSNASGTVRELKTKAPQRQQAVTRKGKTVHQDPEQLKYKREWLRARGHEVSPFGKIPDKLEAKFAEAHQPAVHLKDRINPPFGSELFSASR